MPWLSEEDSEQIEKERIWLKTPDTKNKTNPYRDLEWLDFSPDVLEKYRTNPLCSISSDNISFIGTNGKHVSDVAFIMNKGKLMVRAGDFAFVPPKQRDHWNEFSLAQDEDENLLK